MRSHFTPIFSLAFVQGLSVETSVWYEAKNSSQLNGRYYVLCVKPHYETLVQQLQITLYLIDNNYTFVPNELAHQ